MIAVQLGPGITTPPTARGPHAFGGRRVRRAAVGLFFGSVAVNAALGIYALLFAGDVGEIEGKILGTSASVTGTLVLALACLPAWEQRLLGVVPAVGAAASLVGFALVIVAIWTEPEGEFLAKTIGTVLTVAVAVAFACVVALARLPHRRRHVLTAELVLIAVAAGMLEIQWWGEFEGGWYARAFGVVAIALAALTVSIPVLHRLGRAELAAAWVHEATGGIRFCPYCGVAFAGEEATTLACTHCDRRFSVLGTDVRA